MAWRPYPNCCKRNLMKNVSGIRGNLAVRIANTATHDDWHHILMQAFYELVRSGPATHQ
jgi:hypothetical protein